MAKPRTIYACQECGHQSPRWQGRCNGCGGWNTLVEERFEAPGVGASRAPAAPLASPALPITEVAPEGFAVEPTGLSELDRVLSGGLVPGSVTLLGGEPGIGKSTLLLQLAASVASRGRRVLYLSGEESVHQVRMRAERLGALHDNLWMANATTLDEVRGHLAHAVPALLLVDSIQTVHDTSLSSAPGSVAQVRECAAAIVAEAKRGEMAAVLVGHVTKDGALAGPRVLEHLVDTVLSFEGDRSHGLRLLNARKHRFGSTSELGVFEMSDAGLEPVADPSRLFLADRRHGMPGTVVVPTLEGHRPLLVEVQVLVQPSHLPTPRRSAHGLDANRLGLLLAVLARHCGISQFASADVYAMAVGGVRVVEPGADLALALAAVSSATGKPIAGDIVVVGEVGLVGEVRQVAQCERRLREAARLGFTRAMVPASYDGPAGGLRLRKVATLADAVAVLDGASQLVAVP